MKPHITAANTEHRSSDNRPLGELICKIEESDRTAFRPGQGIFNFEISEKTGHCGSTEEYKFKELLPSGNNFISIALKCEYEGDAFGYEMFMLAEYYKQCILNKEYEWYETKFLQETIKAKLQLSDEKLNEAMAFLHKLMEKYRPNLSGVVNDANSWNKDISKEKEKYVLEQLNKTTAIENFLNKRFNGGGGGYHNQSTGSLNPTGIKFCYIKTSKHLEPLESRAMRLTMPNTDPQYPSEEIYLHFKDLEATKVLDPFFEVFSNTKFIEPPQMTRGT